MILFPGSPLHKNNSLSQIPKYQFHLTDPAEYYNLESILILHFRTCDLLVAVCNNVSYYTQMEILQCIYYVYFVFLLATLPLVKKASSSLYISAIIYPGATGGGVLAVHSLGCQDSCFLASPYLISRFLQEYHIHAGGGWEIKAFEMQAEACFLALKW